MLAEKLLIQQDTSAQYECGECPELCQLPLENGDEYGFRGKQVVVCPSSVLDQPLVVSPPKPSYKFELDIFLEKLRQANNIHIDNTIAREEECYIGTLNARGKEWPVFRVPFGFHFQTDKILGLTKRTRSPCIIVGHSFRPTKEEKSYLDKQKYCYLPIGDYIEDRSFRLSLFSLLKRIDPGYLNNPQATEFVFENVQLSIAEEDEQHVVKFDGWIHPGLQSSDIHFAAFLFIAAYRKVKGKDYDGGWIHFSKLGELNSRNPLLNKLREKLKKYPHPELDNSVFPMLIKNRVGDSRVRLALLPHNIDIDSSIKNFHLIGTNPFKKSSQDLTSTQHRYRQNLKIAGERAHSLVEKSLALLYPAK